MGLTDSFTGGGSHRTESSPEEDLLAGQARRAERPNGRGVFCLEAVSVA